MSNFNSVDSGSPNVRVSSSTESLKSTGRTRTSFRRIVGSLIQSRKSSKCPDSPRNEKQLPVDQCTLRLARSSSLPGHTAVRQGNGPLILKKVSPEVSPNRLGINHTKHKDNTLPPNFKETTKEHSTTVPTAARNSLPPKVPRNRPLASSGSPSQTRHPPIPPAVPPSPNAPSFSPLSRSSSSPGSILKESRKSIIKSSSSLNGGNHSPTPSKRVTFCPVSDETTPDKSTAPSSETTSSSLKKEPTKPDSESTRSTKGRQSNLSHSIKSESSTNVTHSNHISKLNDIKAKKDLPSKFDNISLRSSRKGSISSDSENSHVRVHSNSVDTHPPVPPKHRIVSESIKHYHDKSIYNLQNTRENGLELSLQLGQGHQLVRHEQEARIQKLRERNLDYQRNRRLGNLARSNSYSNSVISSSAFSSEGGSDGKTSSLPRRISSPQIYTNKSSLKRSHTINANTYKDSTNILSGYQQHLKSKEKIDERPEHLDQQIILPQKKLNVTKARNNENNFKLKKTDHLAEKDLNEIPLKPPRRTNSFAKSEPGVSPKMKPHKAGSGQADSMKKAKEHPPLQKNTKGQQYQPPELKDDGSLTQFSGGPVVDQCVVSQSTVQSTNSSDDPDKIKVRQKFNLPQELIQPSYDEADSPEGSLLLETCIQGDENQILRLLLNLVKKFSVLPAYMLNDADICGRTPLSICCNNGFMRVVEILTSQANVDINSQDLEKNTPLHHAAQGGHIEVVSHLVNTCSRLVNLDARNIHGLTPLMKAAIQGRTKIAKILVFAGASPHLRDYGKGFNAMEWAKYTGRNSCSELIESVQRTCSNHIRDRWCNDPEIKDVPVPGQYLASGHQYLQQSGDNRDSWLKHKFRKAFHKADSKKEFSVASNLSTLASCISSPLVPVQSQVPEPSVVPTVQITEVSAPDCYNEPDEETESESSSESTDHQDVPGITSIFD